jgi:hypothetical protein
LTQREYWAFRGDISAYSHGNLRERFTIPVQRPAKKKKNTQEKRRNFKTEPKRKHETLNTRKIKNRNTMLTHLPHNIPPLSLLQSSNNKTPLALQLPHLPPFPLSILPIHLLPAHITILPRARHNLQDRAVGSWYGVQVLCMPSNPTSSPSRDTQTMIEKVGMGFAPGETADPHVS